MSQQKPLGFKWKTPTPPTTTLQSRARSQKWGYEDNSEVPSHSSKYPYIALSATARYQLRKARFRELFIFNFYLKGSTSTVTKTKKKVWKILDASK